MIAFVQGKRVSLDLDARTVTIRGELHADTFAFDEAPRRVTFYEKLRAKWAKRGKSHYAASLAAAQRAVAMIDEASA